MLSPHYVRLIRKYLKTLYAPNVPQATLTSALFAWIDIVMGDADAMAAHRRCEAYWLPRGARSAVVM